MNSFTETGLQSEILSAILEMGFEEPTPIQAKTIPHLLTSSQDVIGLAQTGTGKTAAFGLPAIQLTAIEDRGTQTLVLCPTRELCIQITKDITNYAKNIKGLGVVAVYGGASIEPQITALRNRAQIVVATPGRALDLIKRRKLLLGKVDRVVLDEADEMLSMGFKDDLDAILAQTPGEKQILLFSATMSKEIYNITKKFMNNPIEFSAARKNIGAENVNHFYYMAHARDRYEVLKRIADMNPKIYGIVFCRTRRETKEVASKLMNDGYNADALHGDLSQAQRDEVMGRFRIQQLQLLVATDVAARGIDVHDLTHIINYNLPDETEGYIHRSGRTGRAGKSGTSIAIIHTRETGKIREIQKRCSVEFEKKPIPGGKDICKKQLYSLIDRIEKVKVDDKQIEPFLPEIYKKLEWLSREELIKHFVSANFNTFLDYYKNAKDLNVLDSPKGAGRDKRTKQEKRKASFTRLFINIGSKNNLNPARLIGLINEGLNSGNAAVGRIEILKKFSFFEIEENVDKQLIQSLQGKEFEGVTLKVEASQPKQFFETPVKSKPQNNNFRKPKQKSNYKSKGRRTNPKSKGRPF